MIIRMMGRMLMKNKITCNKCECCDHRNLTKVAIGGGAVYATVQQGIWSTDNKQGSRVLSSVRETVSPTATEYISKVRSCDLCTITIVLER